MMFDVWISVLRGFTNYIFQAFSFHFVFLSFPEEPLPHLPQFISPSTHSLHVCCCSCHFCRFSFYIHLAIFLKTEKNNVYNKMRTKWEKERKEQKRERKRKQVKINSSNSEQLLCNRKCWFSNYVVMRDAHKLRELNNRVLFTLCSFRIAAFFNSFFSRANFFPSSSFFRMYYVLSGFLRLKFILKIHLSLYSNCLMLKSNVDLLLAF